LTFLYLVQNSDLRPLTNPTRLGIIGTCRDTVLNTHPRGDQGGFGRPGEVDEGGIHGGRARYACTHNNNPIPAGSQYTFLLPYL
jgi:hypothetical protein